MSKIKFELNKAGGREILNSKELDELLMDYGNAVASVSGIDCNVEVVQSKDRHKVFVEASTAKAYYTNLKHNNLLKAIGR